MSFQGDTDSQRRRKTDSEPAQPTSTAARDTKGGSKRRASSEVGDALKTVYQRTIEEDIPPEMLDLLGKLD